MSHSLYNNPFNIYHKQRQRMNSKDVIHTVHHVLIFTSIIRQKFAKIRCDNLIVSQRPDLSHRPKEQNENQLNSSPIALKAHMDDFVVGKLAKMTCKSSKTAGTLVRRSRASIRSVVFVSKRCHTHFLVLRISFNLIQF